MRRKDRQVTDIGEIAAIIQKCPVCRLGMAEDGKPYVVPLNFGYELDGTMLTLYFHSAKEGRKIDSLRQNPLVCFEMDCGHELIAGTEACGYGYRYESVIGFGNAEFLDNSDEKLHAMKKIMAKYTGSENFDIPSGALGAVEVIRIKTDEYSAKRC